MTQLLLFGAGKSAISLIDYFLKNAAQYQWHLTIADTNKQEVEQKLKTYLHLPLTIVEFSLSNDELKNDLIQQSDFVISMLPAILHGSILKACMQHKKHLATASYVSNEMKSFDNEAKQNQLILLNECGLDPGIDHASAMQIIDQLRNQGAEIHTFKSYCGGLVAPESTLDNPWQYKFSWNPKNVVLAGQSTAQYLNNNELTFIPYNRLFTQIEQITVDSIGIFDGYANRDSMNYKEPYHLNKIKTLLRGTLRPKGYCKAWDIFIKLGLTDDTSIIYNTDKLTYTDLIKAFLPKSGLNVKEYFCTYFASSLTPEMLHMFEYLELFSNKRITLKQGTPAALLQHLLEEKWKLQPGDKDMIVMQHQFGYSLNGVQKQINSSLVIKGDNEIHTAMAKTVGLPLAITIKNFITKQFQLYGVQIPTQQAIYKPLLTELSTHNINFIETHT